MKLTTAEQMKELDRQAIEEQGIPSIDLMARAGAAVAEAADLSLPTPARMCPMYRMCRTTTARRRTLRM